MNSNATSPINTRPPKRFSINDLVLASLFVALSMVLKVAFEIYFTPDLRFNFVNVPIMLSGILLGPIWGFAVGAVTDILNYLIKPAGTMHWGFTLSSALAGFLPGLIFYLSKGKKETTSKIKYSLLNVINFVVLLGGMIYLFNMTGIIKVQDGLIYLKDKPVSWYIIAIILLIFAAYSASLIILLRKKENSKTMIPADKILFSVTTVEIVCSLLLNTRFLYDLYGQAIFFNLPMRFVKSIVVIPIFSFVCFILCNVIARYKLQKK